jgi:outer membrane biosynthesis protein TonB
MRSFFIKLIITQLFILGYTVAASKSAEPAANASSVIVSNAADFVAKLPARVFVLVPNKTADEATTRGIESLGPTPNTEFFVLPKESTRPKAIRQGPPVYPREAGQGKVLIMALIAPTGEVTAVYALAASHPAFATSAAKAVAQWKFKPAKLKDTAVPVIFVQLIEFNMEMR